MRQMQMKGLIPVRAIVTCLRELGTQSPNVENPITGDREITDRMGLCVFIPQWSVSGRGPLCPW